MYRPKEPALPICSSPSHLCSTSAPLSHSFRCECGLAPECQWREESRQSRWEVSMSWKIQRHDGPFFIHRDHGAPLWTNTYLHPLLLQRSLVHEIQLKENVFIFSGWWCSIPSSFALVCNLPGILHESTRRCQELLLRPQTQPQTV